MTIVLSTDGVALPSWRAVMEGGPIAIEPGARALIERGHAALLAMAGTSEAIYGVNTGFGKLAMIRVAPDRLAELQVNIVRSHQAGVGDPLPEPVVRLSMALKVVSLAHGASGVSPATVDLLVSMVNAGVLPVIPAQGSVGASGDLAPLAHMAAVMIGEGEAVYGGERLPGAEALSRAGLVPVVLGPKEGLALLNGTQVSTALALAALFRIVRCHEAALVTGALSVDAAAGSDAPFDRRIHLLRAHNGQRRVSDVLRDLLGGSEIRESHRHGDPRVQDPYSLRCQPQVMGAALDVIRSAADMLEREAISVTDNPLVMLDTGEVISGGNFHAAPVAFAADMLALAVAEIGNIAQRRIALLVDPVLSGLPAFLVETPGLNSGFMIAEVASAALASENRQRAAPAVIDSIPTSANQEDHVSMATHGARRLLDMAANLERLIGIEALMAAQGIDMRKPLRTSPPLERVRQAIRSRVSYLASDRPMSGDMETAAVLVRTGALAAPVADVTRPTYELLDR